VCPLMETPGFVVVVMVPLCVVAAPRTVGLAPPRSGTSHP
jgi:hypothetical protein